MILQAPTSFLSSIVSGQLSVELLSSLAPAAGGPSEMPYRSESYTYISPGNRALMQNSTLGWLPPLSSIPPPVWLYVPQQTMATVYPGSAAAARALHLDANCCCDFQGGEAALFQSLGWTPGSPANGPWPVHAG